VSQKLGALLQLGETLASQSLKNQSLVDDDDASTECSGSQAIQAPETLSSTD